MKEKLSLTQLSHKECNRLKGGKPPCVCACELFPDATSNQVNNQGLIYFT